VEKYLFETSGFLTNDVPWVLKLDIFVELHDITYNYGTID